MAGGEGRPKLASESPAHCALSARVIDIERQSEQRIHRLGLKKGELRTFCTRVQEENSVTQHSS